MSKPLIIVLLLSFVPKLNAQQNEITIEFLQGLTENFNLSEMQSKMQSKNFDFVERQQRYVDNYTYLYGDNYDADKETAFSFMKIIVDKESEQLTKLSLEGDESAFQRLQTEIRKSGKTGKSFFEDNNVKTVYTLGKVHYIFESKTSDNKIEENITLIPVSSNHNYFDGLIELVYENQKGEVLNTRITKWTDFKYEYVNEKYGNEFEYSRTSLDNKNNFHLDYQYFAGNIRVSLVQNGNVIFSYFNNEKVIINGQFLSGKDVDGKFKIDEINIIPKLGNLTTSKKIKNFVNGKTLVEIVVNNGDLMQLNVSNPNGESQEKMSFVNRRKAE